MNAAAGQARVPRERLRGSRAELSWLLRTTYISNDLQDGRQHGGMEKQARVNGGPGADDAIADDRDAQIAMIEVFFLCLQTSEQRDDDGVAAPA